VSAAGFNPALVKFVIALTHYWLRLHVATDILSAERVGYRTGMQRTHRHSHVRVGATWCTEDTWRKGRNHMKEVIYTLGVWRVKPGKEAAFIDAWKALGNIFARLPQTPGKGTLIQSLTDPLLFYSFGPWSDLADVEAMRANPEAQEGINQLRELCTEATPGGFRVVAEA
jgi:quinol monooxygenase YgiN